MKTIFLLRHGEKVREKGDVELTELGKQQALKAGDFLINKNIESIISSPSLRCVQTAQAVSETLNLPYTKEPKLKERIDFGDVKNQSYDNYLKLCGISTTNRNFILPNGETSIHTGERIQSVIDSNIGVLLLVTHGGAIADYIRNTFNVDVIRDKWDGFFKYFSVPYCSITQVDIMENSIPKLVLLGSFKYLL